MSRLLIKVRFFARAALALSMLVGYYTLSLVVAAGALALMVVLARWHAPGIAYLFFLALAGLSLWTAGKVLFESGKSEGDLPGVPLEPAAEPALFSLVSDVARDVGTRPPDEIRLIPDANAFVTERGGFLGFGRRRVLALGYLDLRKSNRSELIATLAHELGHFGAGDTFLGPMVHRAHYVLVRSVSLLEEGGGNDHYSISTARTLLTSALKAYAKVALRVSLGVARLQELEADRVAVRLAGKGPHVRSLARMGADIATFHAYIAHEVGPLADQGFWPRRFWDGYDAFEAATREETEAALRDREKDPYDTHPSLEERERFAESLSGADPEEDTRPALALLADANEPWARLEAEMVSEKLELCDWSSAAHLRGKRVFEAATETHQAYAALHIGGSWVDAARGALRCLAAEGPYRLVIAVVPELGQANGPAWQALAPVILMRSLGAVVAMALVEERGGRFVHAFGSPLLVEIGGERVSPFLLVQDTFVAREPLLQLERLLEGAVASPVAAPSGT